MSVIRTLHIYLSKDARIRGYFSMPILVREQKVWETLLYILPPTAENSKY